MWIQLLRQVEKHDQRLSKRRMYICFQRVSDDSTVEAVSLASKELGALLE